MTRLAVFEKLREKIQTLGIEILYRFKCENVIEHEDHVEAISSDGQRIKGKYLVGAAGVGSKVRSLLNPGASTEKRYAGYLGVGLIYPSATKKEMTLYHHAQGNVGLGSLGKISTANTDKSNFMWLHFHMAEDEAKAIKNEEVYTRLEDRAKVGPSTCSKS